MNERFTDTDADEVDRIGDHLGLFQHREEELGPLGDVAGLDVVELGCGTAYSSRPRFARAGARPVAVDLSPAQLDTARRCQLRHGTSFPLVEANGERLPLKDRSLDLVVSEYGAGPWCDPSRWLAEAARVLRPRLAGVPHPQRARSDVRPEDAGPAGDLLLRRQREMSPIAWPGGGVEHHPGHGDWISLLRAAGFAVGRAARALRLRRRRAARVLRHRRRSGREPLAG